MAPTMALIGVHRNPRVCVLTLSNDAVLTPSTHQPVNPLPCTAPLVGTSVLVVSLYTHFLCERVCTTQASKVRSIAWMGGRYPTSQSPASQAHIQTCNSIAPSPLLNLRHDL